MQKTLRPVLLLLGLSALGIVHASSKQNELTIIIANGPLAGTYTPPPSGVICLHAKKQRLFSVAYKDFNPHGAKEFTEGGMEVTDPDDPGEKHGDIQLTFGADKNPTTYSIPYAALKFELTGQGANISFEGATKSNIKLHVTARCADVTSL